MSRPLRIEFSGALYHITLRGNAGRNIFLDDEDREHFLLLLGKEVFQQQWECHSYCLMNDHYHIIIETPEPGLSRGLGRLNMTYCQAFNRRHQCRGHLFEGRYKAILVEQDRYLLTLCRHVVLNPVRIGLVKDPKEWPWSSYQMTAFGIIRPGWLNTKWLLGQFSDQFFKAQKKYRDYINEKQETESIWKNLRGQIYLGSDAFIAEIIAKNQNSSVDQVAQHYLHPLRPKVNDVLDAVAKAAGMNVKQIFNNTKRKDAFQVAVYLLRRRCNLTLKEVARMANISIPRISQIQRLIEDNGGIGLCYEWARSLEDLSR